MNAVLPQAPFEFDAEFLAELPYEPQVLLFDRVLELDREASRVRCRMPTDRPIPFTDQQRVHPEKHPRHVAGAALVDNKVCAIDDVWSGLRLVIRIVDRPKKT